MNVIMNYIGANNVPALVALRTVLGTTWNENNAALENPDGILVTSKQAWSIMRCYLHPDNHGVLSIDWTVQSSPNFEPTDLRAFGT